ELFEPNPDGLIGLVRHAKTTLRYQTTGKLCQPAGAVHLGLALPVVAVRGMFISSRLQDFEDQCPGNDGTPIISMARKPRERRATDAATDATFKWLMTPTE